MRFPASRGRKENHPQGTRYHFPVQVSFAADCSALHHMKGKNQSASKKPGGSISPALADMKHWSPRDQNEFPRLSSCILDITASIKVRNTHTRSN